MLNHQLAKLYGHLPGAARTLVASAYGARLRMYRYGPETARLQDEARERETWIRPRWNAWREDQLARLLHRAATRVPYYRDRWAERRRKGDRASVEILSNWPLLEKSEIQEHLYGFIAEDQDPPRMVRDSTSGTSGSPLVVFRSRRTSRGWFALLEARSLQWHGLSRQDRYAIFGGQSIVPRQQRTPPYWVWNAPMKQLYCSSFHLSRKLIPHHLDALERYKVRYVSGYPSSLEQLALGAVETGARVPRVEAVFTHSEPLYPHQRRAIEQAFGCGVFQYYGMTELVTGASECSAGTMHAWPEMGYLEVHPHRSESDGTGELVSTSLLDQDMPLIRYRTGDLGSLETDSVSTPICPCGRTLPVLSGLDGREEDLLRTMAGERVYMPPWPDDAPLRESQVIQEDADHVTVIYVPRPGADADALQTVRRHMQDLLGPVSLELKKVDQIPRGSNGKFRWVVSRV